MINGIDRCEYCRTIKPVIARCHSCGAPGKLPTAPPTILPRKVGAGYDLPVSLAVAVNAMMVAPGVQFFR